MYSDIEALYMTNMGLYLSIFAVSIGFIKQRSTNLAKIYTSILPTVFTIEFGVTTVFWTFYAIDPKFLVNRKFLLEGYQTPLLTELGIHLFPFILLFIDQYNVPMPNDKKQRAFLLIFFTSWITTVVILGETKGKYLYPFMNKFSNGFPKILYFYASIPVFYLIGTTYLRLKTREK